MIILQTSTVGPVSIHIAIFIAYTLVRESPLGNLEAISYKLLPLDHHVGMPYERPTDELSNSWQQ